eukprot:TRINITY_DN90542_c0_g1_i1.p1 TRINITY_DN90542_c0_g1~~TRINITY_DN90542_c0_g1_i1.p1  ORF type:complete len:365 (+),score=88.10 TRINITY_DN90542_c0_g1_i1:37-1095(+)
MLRSTLLFLLPWSAKGSVALSAASLEKLLGTSHPLGGLLLGAEDLSKLRTSLGRIRDEAHAILGVLDEHPLETDLSGAALQNEQPELSQDIMTSGLPQSDREEELSHEEPGSDHGESSGAKPSGGQGDELVSEESPTESVTDQTTSDSDWRHLFWRVWAHAWSASQVFFRVGVFLMDIGTVVGMMLFLESVGGNKRKSNILSKKTAQKEIAKQSSAGAVAPGTPIPTPTATAGRERSEWLSWLSQEEFLAACLTEHWFKLALGLALAVGGRLPQYLLDKDGLLFHMIVNVSVTLRGISLAMLFIRDDMLFPKREDVVREKEAQKEAQKEAPKPLSAESVASHRASAARAAAD